MSEDPEVVSNGLWALAFLAEDRVAIKHIQKSLNIARTVEFVLSPSPSVAVPAIRIVSSLFSSGAVVAVSAAGGVRALQELVRRFAVDPAVTLEACRALSSLAASGNGKVLLEPGIIGDLGKISSSTADYGVILCVR